jgi:hypothetical protein
MIAFVMKKFPKNSSLAARKNSGRSTPKALASDFTLSGVLVSLWDELILRMLPSNIPVFCATSINLILFCLLMAQSALPTEKDFSRGNRGFRLKKSVL